MLRNIRYLMAVAVFAMLLDMPTVATAAWPHARRHRAPAAQTQVPSRLPVSHRQPPPESYDAGWFYPQLYPKYFGGLHYRTLETYGFPFGEDGFRGTAW